MDEDPRKALLSEPDGTDTSNKCIKRYTISAAICNVVAVFLLIFVLAINPILFQLLVNSQVVLTNGTLSFEQWLAPTPLIYKIATVYNITNTAEVEAGGTPNITAIGPYYFIEHREKIRVEEVYSRELRYGEKKWYEFDWNTTNHNRTVPLDPKKDHFTTFNIAYIGVAYNLTLAGDPPKEVIGVITDAILQHEIGLFMNRTVNDVVFGYEDKFLKLLQVVMPGLPSTVQLVYNMSDRDIATTSRVMNGGEHLSELGQYTEWQGYRKLPYWKTDEANAVNGTEGLFFAPNLDKTETITTFVDDLFRANPMEFVGEEECFNISTTYKYKIPDYVLANASTNPLNEGFYAYGPNGMMNLTAAVMAPVFASKPSFLGAESWLIDEVNGLPPADNETMDTNIWVEPYTGVLVKAMKQLQANMMITQLKAFPGLQTLREKPRYVPISLILENGGMDADLVHTFKNKVFKPKFIFEVVLWVLFGTANFIAGALWVIRWKKLKEYSSNPVKSPNSPNPVTPDNVENVYNDTNENDENVYNDANENDDDDELINAYSVPETQAIGDVYQSV